MKILQNMKIGPRLIVGFLIVAMIAVIVGAIGIINLNAIQTASNHLYEENTMGIDYAGKATIFYQRIRFNAVKMNVVQSQSDVDYSISNIQNDFALTEDYMNKYLATIKTAEAKTVYDELIVKWQNYKSILSNAVSLTQNKQIDDSMQIILNDAADAGNNLQADFDKILEINEKDAQLTNDQNQKNQNESTVIMLFVMIAGAVTAMLLGFLISRGISRPIQKIVSEAEKIAAGDLDFKLDYNAKDEIALLVKAFKNMIGSIQNLAKDSNMLAEAAIEGRLSTRADSSQHHGEYRKIMEGVNKTLDAVIDPVNEAKAVLGQISKGNLNVSMTGNYSGDHAIIKNALNDTVVNLKNYINEITFILDRIAKGDLTQDIAADFLGDFTTLKDSINRIVHDLNGLFADVYSASEQVAIGATQVSQGNQAISTGATEQASAIEELTSAVSEIAEQTGRNSNHSFKLNELALESKNAALNGNEQMSEMLESMIEINRSSENITKIIKVIDDIAFQTNMLALNAAVEAARAGVHGKGFAVVAEEVRNLAERSARAVKETAGLIESSMKKVEDGTKKANETAGSLGNIVACIEKSQQLGEKIAAVSEEQTNRINQIYQGIEQMSQVIQTNSAIAEEGAASSEELSGQAEALKEKISVFQLSKGNMDKAKVQKAEHTIKQTVIEFKSNNSKY